MELKSVVARPLPRIADYACYRLFLGDFFEYKKSLRAGFSYRQFAQMCRLKSPNYLQLVIRGKRTLTPDTGELIAQALKLDDIERRYFLALIRREAAFSAEETRRAEAELHRSVKGLKTKFVESSESEIFEHWYYFPVRELIFLDDFEPSGEYVAARLSGLITPEQGERALRYLIERGYIVFENGTYQPKDPVLDCGNLLFRQKTLQEFHKKTLAVWAENVENLGTSRQELGLLNIPIPSAKIPELRRRILQFQDEIIGWAQAFEGNDELVQLGTYVMVFEKKEES